MNKENKKILGGRSYKNSKKKESQKISKNNQDQEQKNFKQENLEKKIIQKNRQLKSKIKHLQKEIKRIECANSLNQKAIEEKHNLEQKLRKLLIAKDKFIIKKYKKPNIL